MKPFWRGKKCCTTSQQISKTYRIALLGNPNCGKSTVFNALTGSCQEVGNWPGVTVERKSGSFALRDTHVEVIDLPGIYSLMVNATDSALDERIACQFIHDHEADAILNIVDASHLERHLYLTLQLLELGIPMIIGFNRMDVAKNRGLQIKVEQFAKAFGCNVLPMVARTGEGVDRLKEEIIKIKQNVAPTIAIPYPDKIREVVKAGIPLALLEGDIMMASKYPEATLQRVREAQSDIATTEAEEADILIADARYRFIQALVDKNTAKLAQTKTNWTRRLDAIFLNRLLGIPIFLMMMYALFFFAINVGGAFQDFFDISSNAFLVQGLAHGLQVIHLPDWLIALLANGVGKGINTVLTFIPVIGALFLGLAFLEDSGYMARAAFIVDRLMVSLGLPGKSFVPMIVGFGCNVPAVMAARTLENPRDRVLTVMMTPFMSCGARLAIYAIFITAFFPRGGQNIVFALYLLGIAMAVFTGWLLRRTVLKGKPAPLIMELPSYHWPKFGSLLRHMSQRLSGFVLRAGKLILPICIVLGILNSLNIDGTLNAGEGDAQSLLSHLGRFLTPLFTPMGIHMDNWPATVGLVTGILAKEVVVGTLNTLYSQAGQLSHLGAGDFHFWASMKEAVVSIPQNLSQLGHALSNPISAQAPVHTLSQSVYGVMAARFQTTFSAMAYLLFVLLYFPCVSTVAVMWREVGRRWACFSVLWTTGLAYTVAVLFYQLGQRL